MEGEGVIVGYTALIDPEAIGRGFEVLGVLDRTRKDSHDVRSV